MSERGPSPVLVVLGVVGVAILAAALVFGPGLYRKGREVVAPIVHMTRIEDRMQELDQQLAFEPPEDGAVDEDRLEAFLAVRLEVLPALRQWTETVQAIDRKGEESWEDAAEVLGITRELLDLQLTTLREHQMSPSEFKWLDDLVYESWLEALEAAGVQGGAVRTALLEAARGDLDFVRQLEAEDGRSRALARLESRLEERVSELESPRSPEVEGVPEETRDLLWRHREEIEAASFAEVRQAPIILSEYHDVTVHVGDHDDDRDD